MQLGRKEKGEKKMKKYRIIDADKIMAWIRERNGGGRPTATEIAHYIVKTAVEIPARNGYRGKHEENIREPLLCRDCRFCITGLNREYGFCLRVGSNIRLLDWCAYAERREE